MSILEPPTLIQLSFRDTAKCSLNRSPDASALRPSTLTVTSPPQTTIENRCQASGFSSGTSTTMLRLSDDFIFQCQLKSEMRAFHPVFALPALP